MTHAHKPQSRHYTQIIRHYEISLLLTRSVYFSSPHFKGNRVYSNLVVCDLIVAFPITRRAHHTGTCRPVASLTDERHDSPVLTQKMFSLVWGLCLYRLREGYESEELSTEVVGCRVNRGKETWEKERVSRLRVPRKERGHKKRERERERDMTATRGRWEREKREPSSHDV